MSLFLSGGLLIELKSKDILILKFQTFIESKDVVVVGASLLLDDFMLPEVGSHDIEQVSELVAHIAESGGHVALGDVDNGGFGGGRASNDRLESGGARFREICADRLADEPQKRTLALLPVVVLQEIAVSVLVEVENEGDLLDSEGHPPHQGLLSGVVDTAELHEGVLSRYFIPEIGKSAAQLIVIHVDHNHPEIGSLLNQPGVVIDGELLSLALDLLEDGVGLEGGLAVSTLRCRSVLWSRGPPKR